MRKTIERDFMMCMTRVTSSSDQSSRQFYYSWLAEHIYSRLSAFILLDYRLLIQVETAVDQLTNRTKGQIMRSSFAVCMFTVSWQSKLDKQSSSTTTQSLYHIHRSKLKLVEVLVELRDTLLETLAFTHIQYNFLCLGAIRVWRS